MNTIYVTEENYYEALDAIYVGMKEIRNNLDEEYRDEVYEYDVNDWDSLFDYDTRSYVLNILTGDNGYTYDDLDEMFEYDEFKVETEWDGVDGSIWSVDDLWHRVLEEEIDSFVRYDS